MGEWWNTFGTLEVMNDALWECREAVAYPSVAGGGVGGELRDEHVAAAVGVNASLIVLNKEHWQGHAWP